MQFDGETLQVTYETENSLIGAVLIDSTGGYRDAIDTVKEIVKPEDYFDEVNKRIYAAMLSCSNPPHIANVAKELHLKGELKTGDYSHMLTCISKTPTSLDHEDYAKAIKHYSESRLGLTQIKPKFKGGI